MVERSAADLPVWARAEAFPLAGDSPWGWVDRKGRREECASFEDLSGAIIDDAGARVDLVWTPASRHLVLPEEIPELHPALKDARVRWAEWEIREGQRQMWIFGAFFAGLVGFSVVTGRPLLAFGPAGLALLLFVILGLVPWIQGRKRLRRAKTWAADGAIPDLEGLRFETWLMLQGAPVTRLLVGLMLVVGLIQWLGPLDLVQEIAAAGLTKVDGRPADGWRLATAPFLHGHVLHFLFNFSALAYLSRRVEVLARWPHVVLVLVFSAWVGGEASARFYPEVESIGASGGLLGLLGFLLVFESLHRRLVPQSSRRRLLVGLLLTAGLGALFFRVIDNAAHAGGLLAGMGYALVVFPKSGSARRPDETRIDRVLGGVALGVILLAAAFTCLRLFGG